MTKAKAKPGTDKPVDKSAQAATQPAAEGAAPAQPAQDPGAAEGPDLVSATLGVSAAVDPDAGLPLGSGLAVAPGELQPDAVAIPPELDADLNQRERRTVWYMVEGLTYREALDAAGVPPRAAIRDSAPPLHVVRAVQAVNRQLAMRAGVSREWIITQLVALYRRAAQAEEVLDRKGRPTGTYRFDGATAANCLKQLGEYHPELSPKRRSGLDAGDVVALLQAVAQRGRQQLVADPRVVGQGSAVPAIGTRAAAPQQGTKAQ